MSIYGKKRRIYLLPENLSPEKRIVTFAKCSRSPEPFDQIAKDLTDEKTSKFNERWVVGFGHLSVAEHAALSIAMENVSILATKVIEDNRLASFTEKSTRYQVYDKNSYYKPANIMNSSLGKVYKEAGDYLFKIYGEMYPIVNNYIKKKNPKSEEISDFMYESTCKARTCDIIRYILPVATQTNMGMTLNARNLIYAASKMLSNPLEEMQDIGKELLKIAKKSVPTLAKAIRPIKYLHETLPAMEKLTKRILCHPERSGGSQKPVTLVEYDRDADDRLVAALLYRFSSYPYSQVKKQVKKMSFRQKSKVIDEALKRRSQIEQPLRELEHIYYTFDILMDYGAFRDVQRHRMCTQTNQLVTVEHGYDIPKEIKDLTPRLRSGQGLKKEFERAMDKSAEAYRKIAKKFPFEAQYIVALAFKKRTLITWNLRELHHFISLRSRPAGHISYRRIANQVYDEISKVHPLLAKYIHVVRVK